MIFGKNLSVLTPSVLKARFYDWQQRQQAAASMQASTDEILKTLRRDARAAGLESELDALLAPPAPPIASEATVRVKAVRAFKTLHLGAHGFEEWSGGAGCVTDLPASVAKKLGARVTPVPRETATLVLLRPGDETGD